MEASGLEGVKIRHTILQFDLQLVRRQPGANDISLIDIRELHRTMVGFDRQRGATEFRIHADRTPHDSGLMGLADAAGGDTIGIPGRVNVHYFLFNFRSFCYSIGIQGPSILIFDVL